MQEVDSLMEKKAALTDEVKQTTDELTDVRKGAEHKLFVAVNLYRGFNEISDKAGRAAAIGAAIVAVLSVKMSRTHATT